MRDVANPCLDWAPIQDPADRTPALAQELGGGWARMWEEGVGDVIRRREAWLQEQGPRLTAALLE